MQQEQEAEFVYLIYRGERVVEVCKTPELAERRAGARTGWDRSDEEDDPEQELTVVPMLLVTEAEAELVPWVVELEPDGSVRHVGVRWYVASEITLNAEAVRLARSRRGPNRQERTSFLRVYLWALTREDALQTAQKHRERYIAEGRWPEAAQADSRGN